jgi:hypothetical protein
VVVSEVFPILICPDFLPQSKQNSWSWTLAEVAVMDEIIAGCGIPLSLTDEISP